MTGSPDPGGPAERTQKNRGRMERIVGCNCGKRTRPNGMGVNPPAPQTGRPGGGKWMVRTASGRTLFLDSRAEAEDARIRAGGGSIRRVG